MNKNTQAKKKEKSSVQALEVKGVKTDKARSVFQDVHPIAKSIETALHRLMDIDESARLFIPMAKNNKKSQLNVLAESLKKSAESLGDKRKERAGVTKEINAVLNSARALSRLANSKIPEIMESSLFLGLFSTFDAFMGTLLTAIYSKRPELFNRINQQMVLSQILQHKSFEDLKEKILQSEIERFRRQSYVEQFEELEKTFGITLKAFERWPQFVECSQRRNLITHCDGVVSEQYINVCQSNGHSFSSPVSVGDVINVGSEYFSNACQLLIEVVFKLGQTLWRKVIPEESQDADSHINQVIFDFLLDEKYQLVQIFSEFYLSQKHQISSDVSRKIATINYAISLKFDGKPDKMNQLLRSVDWTATANEFKLAEAVLSDRFFDAAKIMKRMGKEGEILTEPDYHQWPLFREFRKTEPFLDSYKQIYGYSFAEELNRSIEVQLEAKEESTHPEKKLLSKKTPLATKTKKTNSNEQV